MNAVVNWREGMSFTGSADSGFTVSLGADPAVGGADDGFRPLELMLVSLAGCTAMDVISILRKKQQPVSGFSVKVRAERAQEHPKVFTRITILYHLTGRDLDEVALRRAIELTATKYCPAQAMLGRVVPMELKYQIDDDAGNKQLEGTFILPEPGE
jgi:putative redox protein